MTKTLPSQHFEAGKGESGFFKLQAPASPVTHVKVEDVMKRLFSKEHLHFILGDHVLFYRFSSFLNRYKPQLVPTLVRYLEMRKAMKAIEYANAVARSIRWPTHTDYCKFSRVQAGTTDVRFEDYASKELLLLISEALTAFITHSLIGVIADCISKDVTGEAIPVVQNLIGSLAEVFCLTDPSAHDNPIIFASEEFYKTTQYGNSYAIDRNCRFLQGPATDKDCLLRITKAVSLGQESNEIILNYRRDGTPFINLLMCAPLHDDKGIIRYFIGAQIDVTGLVVEGLGIESFRALLQRNGPNTPKVKTGLDQYLPSSKKHWQFQRTRETQDALQELSVMFNQDESDIVAQNIRCAENASDNEPLKSGVPGHVQNRGQTKRVIEEAVDPLLKLSSIALRNGHQITSHIPGVYKHYLLVHPYPSLKIIFVSPSLRVPGLLRTPLFSKLGGSAQTISALESAFRDGASVTAKVLWLPKNSQAGNPGYPPTGPKLKFIRCTPLLGSDDQIGVWMVILVPVEESPSIPSHSRGDHSMVDETSDARRELETKSRAASRSATVSPKNSLENDIDTDRGFGVTSNNPREVRSATPLKTGRRAGESRHHAGHLRSLSSNAILGGPSIALKNTERERSEGVVKTQNDIVVSNMTKRDERPSHVGMLQKRKDCTAGDVKCGLQKSRVNMGTESGLQLPFRGPLNSSPVVAS